MKNIFPSDSLIRGNRVDNMKDKSIYYVKFGFYCTSEFDFQQENDTVLWKIECNIQDRKIYYQTYTYSYKGSAKFKNVIRQRKVDKEIAHNLSDNDIEMLKPYIDAKKFEVRRGIELDRIYYSSEYLCFGGTVWFEGITDSIIPYIRIPVVKYPISKNPEYQLYEYIKRKYFTM
jgi:hypothetical protein